jgi:tetratricopeptide (TPR) repeat protein
MQNEEVNLNEKINEFVRKNRKPIFVSLGLLLAVFAGTVAFFSLTDFFRKKAISEVEELNRRYESLRFTITEESASTDTTSLLADLDAFAKKTSGYAGARAWAIIAGIHGDKKEWAQCETAWRGAAKTAGKTYLAPIAFFNAAVAAEEQGKNEEAVELYTQSISQAAAFPAAAHAQFAIGRLKETLNDKPAALEAYRAVLANWPDDSTWANFAQNRIIALELVR